MKLDIDLLIAYFGGVNALAEALRRHDPEGAASTAAIYKWRTRGSLPLAQLQRLTALAEAQGRPLDLNAFLEQQPTLQRAPAQPGNSRIVVFDTTLRDGEQSPGAAMTKEEKVRVARQLERLGVDVIEAGFAAASPGDWEAVHDQPFARWRGQWRTIYARPARRLHPHRKSASTPSSPPVPSIWNTS